MDIALSQPAEWSRRSGDIASRPIDGRRLVFIGGLHRSGTSIIHRCLGDHPCVSGFHDTGVYEDEGQHLQSVYPPASAFGGPGRFGFHPQSFLDENSPLATAESARRLVADWARHWDAGRKLLVEKSPPNLVRTRFLQALFPGCRFIIVVRHPIAVAYATQKWTACLPQRWFPEKLRPRLPRAGVRSLVEHWLICHERFAEDRPKLRNVHVLRYEDFVARPEHHLNSLYAFLGLPGERLKREVRGGVNDRYWARWQRRRRNILTRSYADGLVRGLEERVHRFGYSLVQET